MVSEVSWRRRSAVDYGAVSKKRCIRSRDRQANNSIGRARKLKDGQAATIAFVQKKTHSLGVGFQLTPFSCLLFYGSRRKPSDPTSRLRTGPILTPGATETPDKPDR